MVISFSAMAIEAEGQGASLSLLLLCYKSIIGHGRHTSFGVSLGASTTGVSQGDNLP